MTSPRGGAVVVLLTCALVLSSVRPAVAYLKFGVNIGGRSVTLKWNRVPVRYFVTDTGVDGVGPVEFAAALSRAFSTWEAVPSASVTYQAVGFTSAAAGEDDGLNTIGFRPESGLDNVLAVTSFLIDDASGELLESDIFFNSAFPWSTAAGGQSTRFDVESVALHEIGHLSGLGHSLLGETELVPGGRRVTAAESVMFPIAFGRGNILNRTLRADDVAGISDLYPDAGFNDRTGSISGTVTKNGAGIFGAHIVAFNPATGSLVANFSLTRQGEFSIAGLALGPHVVRVEPLDDAEIDSFFDSVPPVDIDFRVGFHPRLVIVPAGGDSGSVDLAVQSK
jgi:hypothetical protein